MTSRAESDDRAPPEGVPHPLLTSRPDDHTLRVGVVGQIDDEPTSDGICDDSYDGPTMAAKANQTAMVRLPSGATAVVKAGHVPPAGAQTITPAPTSPRVRRDGLGQQIDPRQHYFIQDSRGYVGNMMSFWRPDGKGYCCCIDDAGRYRGDALPGGRETDVAWPVGYIESKAARYVDAQRVGKP